MKGIKNFEFGKKLTATLLAGALACSLSSCSGKVKMGNVSPTTLLSISDVKDLTLVDELISAGELQFEEGIDIVAAAEKLEQYMEKIEKLSKIDFSEVSLLSPLTDEQCRIALALSDEDIESLKDDCKYKGDSLAQLEKKLTAYKMLSYLKSSCLSWVHAYGQDISIEYMMAAVKGAVADEFDIPVDDYQSVKIEKRPSSYSNNEPETDYTVSVGDKQYTVTQSAGELWNTINYIYNVQEAELTNETEFPTYRKALNFGKTTMAAGVNVNKDKLVAQNNENYIRKNYVKH